jgi:hypothetical protein
MFVPLANVIRMIRSRRIRWAGHEGIMRDKRNAFKVLVLKPEGKNWLGVCVHRRKILQKVLRRTNRLLCCNATETVYKTTPPTILRCRGNLFTEPLHRNDRGIHGHTVSPSTRHGPYRKRRLQQFLVAARTCLPGRCLATIREDTHTDRLMRGNYEIRREMGSGAMINIPSFIKIG